MELTAWLILDSRQTPQRFNTGRISRFKTLFRFAGLPFPLAKIGPLLGFPQASLCAPSIVRSRGITGTGALLRCGEFLSGVIEYRHFGQAVLRDALTFSRLIFRFRGTREIVSRSPRTADSDSEEKAMMEAEGIILYEQEIHAVDEFGR
jgi:hypothetical protein